MPKKIVEASKQSQVRFIGDGIGGYIFPEFQPAFDAMYSIAKILEMLALQKTRLGKLLRAIPHKSYVKHRKVSLCLGQERTSDASVF